MPQSNPIPTVHNFQDLRGQRFGKLVVVSYAGRQTNGHTMWNCLCDCGGKRTIWAADLKAGRTRSCWCLRRAHVSQLMKKIKRTHGRTRTPEYRAWSAIKTRCYNRNAKEFKRYGGRGIRLCQGWRENFESFYADLGPRPTNKFSLDRIDNDGSYSCGHCSECLKKGWTANCRWANWSEQRRNRADVRLLTAGGVTLHLVDWAKQLGMARQNLMAKLKKGHSLERIIEERRDSKC